MKKTIICLILLLASVQIFAKGGGNPDSAKECAICHYEWMDPFFYEFKGTDLVPYQKERVVATQEICFGCHDGTVVDSRKRVWAKDMHKTGVEIPEEMKVPDILPLKNGKIVCKTCHTAHGTGNPREEGYERSIFLRMENGNSELCKSCHTKKTGHYNHPQKQVNYKISEKFYKYGGELGTDNNQVICQSCHTPHGPKESKLLIGYLEDSDICSMCHTDKLNPNLSYKKGLLNHPVNIKHKDKKEVNLLKNYGGMFAGKSEIICLSCHNTHKGVSEQLLVISNRGDQLCLVCHDSKKEIYRTKHNMKREKGFTNKMGESPFNHGVCNACHSPHGWSLKLGKGDDLVEKACLSCHSKGLVAEEKNINNNLYNHPTGKKTEKVKKLPLFGEIVDYFSGNFDKRESVMTCATCHNVHKKTKNFLRDETENSRLCLDCHEKKKEILSTGHGKEEVNCLSCHKIHNAKSKKLLKNDKIDREGTGLGCFNCHSEGKKAEKKVIGENSHPVNVKLKSEMLREINIDDKVLTCVSCHNPHKKTENLNDMEMNFMRIEGKNYDEICSECHENKDKIYNTDHDLRESGESKSICNECHLVHNAKSERMIFSFKVSKDKGKSICLNCHRDEGLADKKPIEKVSHPVGTVEKFSGDKTYLDNKSGKYFLSCNTCHDPHFNGPDKGEEGDVNNSFIKIKNGENVCLACHTDKKDIYKTKHYVAEFPEKDEKAEEFIEEGDVCGICHTVHNSGEYLLQKNNDRPVKWCENCHSENGYAEEKTFDTSHPYNEKFNADINMPLFNGKLVCATCHDPHLSNNKFVRIQTKEGNDFKFCSECHSGKKQIVRSDHNMLIFKKENFDNVCNSCHKMHNFPEKNSFLFPFEVSSEKGFVKEVCFYCHNKDGIAEKKTVKRYGHPYIPVTYKYNEKIADLVFNKKGENDILGSITCATCHEAHIWTWKKGSRYRPMGNLEGNQMNSFLRFDEVTGMCSACHGVEALPRFKYYHTNKYRNEKSKGGERKRSIFDFMIGH